MIGSTVHKVIGSDVGKIVSSVCDDPMYVLWERGQVVMLSRTNYSCDIMFVGDHNETADALLSVLMQPEQYGEYTAMVIDQLGIHDLTVTISRMRSGVGAADIDQ